jgi:hypothetical protein
MNNKNILIVIAVIALAIFAYVAIDNSRQRTLGGSIDEAIEEVADEIDDNTTKR